MYKLRMKKYSKDLGNMNCKKGKVRSNRQYLLRSNLVRTNSVDNKERGVSLIYN